ncbi:MAG TPA: PAS domain S-box protein [Verrucomicrobiae bacterium]|nr:PAS domain S-box protein [Verrucomicrobiae bacterium]
MKDYRKLRRSELIARIRTLETDQAARAKTHRARSKVQRREAEAAVQDREARLRAILETAVEGIITIDEHGMMESVNASAEKLFGYQGREMVGKNVSLLMPSPHRELHDRYLDNYLRTGHAKIIGVGREIVARRKDGSVFPIYLSVSEVRLADRRLFTGFIRDITERKRLEREILDSSEREKRRIGQDLHDGLCQHLAGIELKSQVLEQQLSKRSRVAAAKVGEIAENVREAISQTRLLARGLSPVTLDSEGLMSALRELSLNTEKFFGVVCDFKCDPPVLVPDHAVATNFYRLAQEAVSNAIKHGKATCLSILLCEERGRVILKASDNGAGFPPKMPRLKGMGLRIMQSRAGMIGGTLAIERNASRGVTVICAAPNKDAAYKTKRNHGRQK